MPRIHLRPPWRRADLHHPTDEQIAIDRRAFLAALGLGGAMAGAHIAGCSSSPAAAPPPGAATKPATRGRYPALRNPRFKIDRKLTRREAVLRHINYYEFDSADKPRAVRLAQHLTTSPWTVTVAGLVKKAKMFDIDDLERRFRLEERLYRHRCVETWAMTLPWVGFPLRKLLDWVEPLSGAKFVRFVSFNRPAEAPGMRPGSAYPWPYHEGLRLDEARNDLTLLATGMYGHRLPKQNGAPLRLVVPWKYGYKSIKAIERIELVAEQPPTFWNTVTPREYPFYSNVDPAVPHPRWSQAEEWMIDGHQAERRKTLPYNGYGDLVAGMYM
ncbi:MAG: protein-methionine-sulfoxide reductase catalytic subunit MsrP [Phycisphaerae bacterium]